MKSFKHHLNEANFDGHTGKGFKDKNVASRGGQTAAKHRRQAAGTKHQQAMIDAALKQDKKAFDKVAKISAKMRSKMFGFKVNPKEMWSVKKAKAMSDGSYWKMDFKDRDKL